MKTKLSYLLVSATLLFLTDCRSKGHNNTGQARATDTVPTDQYSKTFPFSNTAHVVVLSYPDRMDWENSANDGRRESNENVIPNGNILIPKDKIRDSIRLQLPDCRRLFEILYSDSCSESLHTMCFEPRHSFIFFDTHDHVFASIEICLQCGTFKTTDGVSPFILCHQKIKQLKGFMKSVGVRYFGDSE
jgi:hypothetical protein